MQEATGLELRFWRDVVGLLSTNQTLHQGLREVAGLIVRHFQVASCAVYLLERGTDELVLQVVGGEEQAAQTRLRVGQGITGMAAFQGKPIQVSQVQRDPRVALPPGRPAQYQSIVAVSINDGERLLGAFNLRTTTERHFSAGEIDVLERVAKPSAVALIRSARTFENMQRRTGELQALNELGQAINSGLGLDETLELIATRAAEALRAKGAAIRLVVEDGTLALGTVFTAPQSELDLQHERRIAEYVAGTGEPIMIDDVRTDRSPRTLGSSLACIPMVLEDRIVGTLTLFDKIAPLGTARRLFGMDDLNTLFALSSQIAAEIEDIRLTGRLQELVRTEKQQAAELRRLYNRSQALLESISDGLVAMDRNGEIVEANSVAKRILGLREPLARDLSIDELVEDKPLLRERLRRGEQFSNRVVTLIAASGRVAAMANLQPVADAREQASGAVLTFREMGEVGRLVNGVIGVQRTFTFDDLIGESPAIEKTKDLARIAAGTDSNVLIQGETGTGKEVFAQAIHNASAFSEGPFLAVNCAALPRDLIESELFGYVEGAFTGASRKGRLGKFELASGGSLFLDEIGDIPPEVQAKLLRVIQEKAIVRVGGDRTIPVDCRLIAATNRDLHHAVSEQRFRRDLLYRLNVITIEVPPLRERGRDVSLFVPEFLRNLAASSGKAVEGVDQAVMDELLRHAWPGNVRELENALEHAAAVARGPVIQWGDLPAHLESVMGATGTAPDVTAEGLEQAQRACEASVRRLYLEALRTEQGNVPRAAQLLGMSRATFYRKIKKHGLARGVSELRLQSQ